MDEQAVIQVNAVSKCYGENKAIKSVSFQVKRGELFGLIGRHGSGKSTLLELLMGHRLPDEGTIKVLGVDVKGGNSALKENISIFMQSTSLVDKLTVREALHKFQSFFHQDLKTEGVIEQFGLSAYADKEVKRLSGGLRQKAMLAIAVSNDPQVVFLDEPTTGLDAAAKQEYWKMLSALKMQGKTIIINSHDMSEIYSHCDRVGVMRTGQLVACNKPRQLIDELPYGGMTMEAVYMHYAIHEVEGGVEV
ncbi:ABC transporter ATP-binding protein [Paenibacillus chungangensis]|uniref:ABC transporter ATP-binding protein n=1 Tax=Paenibacillus chungangensis TaxID=696535 RepID=A0ABW3HTL2_9BACL